MFIFRPLQIKSLPLPYQLQLKERPNFRIPNTPSSTLELSVFLTAILPTAPPPTQHHRTSSTTVKMTLYYTLVFMLLMAEMGLFMLLIVPLPFTVRRKMFTYAVPTSSFPAQLNMWQFPLTHTKQLHLGKPDSSKTTIWVKNNLYIHPHPLHR